MQFRSAHVRCSENSDSIIHAGMSDACLLNVSHFSGVCARALSTWNAVHNYVIDVSVKSIAMIECFKNATLCAAHNADCYIRREHRHTHHSSHDAFTI